MTQGEIPHVSSGVQKEWGHFTAPITEAEKWKVLYAEEIQELKAAGEGWSQALKDVAEWRGRAMKAERALERLKNALKSWESEAQ